jgi:hypothetical protein
VLEYAMASRTITLFTDDIDGTEDNVSTVSFSFDGTSYEIDLSDKNRSALEEALSLYIGHARRIGRKTGIAGSRTVKVNPGEIRAWARGQGLQVPERGRIPQAVLDAWDDK